MQEVERNYSQMSSIGNQPSSTRIISFVRSTQSLARLLIDVILGQISADFCNPYLNFETLSLKLPIGLSFPLKSSWDGQPITFICRSRDHKKTFFVLTFDIVEDEKSQTRVIEEEKEVVGTEDDLGVD